MKTFPFRVQSYGDEDLQDPEILHLLPPPPSLPEEEQQGWKGELLYSIATMINIYYDINTLIQLHRATLLTSIVVHN